MQAVPIDGLFQLQCDVVQKGVLLRPSNAMYVDSFTGRVELSSDSTTARVVVRAQHDFRQYLTGCVDVKVRFVVDTRQIFFDSSLGHCLGCLPHRP